MRKRKNVFLLLSLVGLLLIGYSLISTNNKSQAWWWSDVNVVSVSTVGDLQVGSNVTFQATIVNTHSSSRIRDIGVVFPMGILNQSSTLIEGVSILGESFKLINFTAMINSSGDFGIIFYILQSGAIDDLKDYHLLINSAPSGLPDEIVINETIWINNTIPVDIEENINVSNYIENNNYNNFTLFLNDTEYYEFINNITNIIHNEILFNITNEIYIDIIVNNTIIINMPGSPTQTASLLGVLGVASIGMYGIMSAENTHTSYEGVSKKDGKKRKKDGKLVDARGEEGHWYNLLPIELNRKLQYGMAMLFGAIAWVIGSSIIYPTLDTVTQTELALGYDLEIGAILFGIFVATFVALLVLSIDAVPLFTVSLVVPLFLLAVIEEWIFFIAVTFVMFGSLLFMIYLWQKH